MKNIGKKIKELRIKKGLSQEELAENATVNLRTIQRIENDENNPSGKTLRLICKALDVNVESIFDYGKYDDKTYLTLFHLSVIVFVVFPIGNIILPLILWLTKKDKISGLNEIGANLINFQVLWTILFYAFMIFGVLGKLMHNNFKLFIYSIVILYLINIVFPIVFAIKTNKGVFKPLYINFKYLRIIRY